MDKKELINELKKTITQLAQELDKCKESNSRQQKHELAAQSTFKYFGDVHPLTSITKSNNPDQEEGGLVLSKISGNPNFINENKGHNFARAHTLLHLKSNSVCTWIPKNSCSTLRYSIALENGAISGIDDLEWIHKNNLSFAASVKELLRANYSFVILRNPFKRLLSFYCDKLCHNTLNQNDSSYSNLKSLLGASEKTTFADFIELLWNNPGLKEKDQHIRDQCDFLVYKNYHDYLAFEKYDQTIYTIREKTGIILEDIRSKNSIYTTLNCDGSDDFDYNMPSKSVGSLMLNAKKPLVERMYNKELIRKAGTLYFNDILLYLNTIDSGEAELHYWLKFLN